MFRRNLVKLTQTPTTWDSWLIHVAASSLVVGVSLYLSVSAYLKITEPNLWQPLYGSGYEQLQEVGEETVAPGGILHVTATKCSREDNVDTYGLVTWHRLEPSIKRFSAANPTTSTKQSGCTTSTFENKVPIDLPPGIYELSAEVVASKGQKEQKIIWTTKRFTVTSPN